MSIIKEDQYGRKLVDKDELWAAMRRRAAIGTLVLSMHDLMIFPGESATEQATLLVDTPKQEGLRALHDCGWMLHSLGLPDKLMHHMSEKDDPCQDRGVEWPCDIARWMLGLEDEADRRSRG